MQWSKSCKCDMVGLPMDGEPLDVTDLRWQLLQPTKAGAATRVALEMRIAPAVGKLPRWRAIGGFDAGVLNQGLRYAADQRVVATTITSGDGKAVRRLPYLHPVLADTPLGCRVVEVDRLVDTFTMSGPDHRLEGAVAELARDREQTYKWQTVLQLAEAVASRPADACPLKEMQSVADRMRLGPIQFSPRMTQAMEKFVGGRGKFPTTGADLLRRARKCASSPSSDMGRCLCTHVAPEGLPAWYWFPEDHTSQVRERKSSLNASLAWIEPSTDKLGHFDFWKHTTFALRDGQSGQSDNDNTAALDFPSEQLIALRQLVSTSLPAYVKMQLGNQTDQEFMGPLEEFVICTAACACRLERAIRQRLPIVAIA